MKTGYIRTVLNSLTKLMFALSFMEIGIIQDTFP